MTRLFLRIFPLLILLGCGNDELRRLSRIELPNDSPLLTVGGDRGGYRMLDEDSLFSYRNLALITPDFDSLTPHRMRAVERFYAAGGVVTIVDDRPDVPYAWNWYAGARTLSQDSILPAASAVTSLPPPAPRADRFQVEVLDQNIYEPMEMEVLPRGEVLFLERRGKMKRYVPRLGRTEVVHEFDVCIEGNYEDGLHGLALDPGYGKDNHFIYLYYTPAPCDSTDQFLSRFEYRDGVLDPASEIVVLRVGVQRETCCHSGGGLEFGPDGLLYLSTGDNTSSKESDGYTPIDERPGRAPFDAQKSSGNTADLRGKILRIRPLADGSYEIPEGNLFADGDGGRPEIYVMGARNPFRIAIDPESNYLYWGDVGPDVGQAGRYGPQSYDEWNQARSAGNYGWPYFVGNNFAYPERDFATDEVGPRFDPERPVNASPNNTGARTLPPARPALIWYPYGPSAEFPQLGQGSRSAMAGPFYAPERNVPITGRAFPDYYAGKWFIYEWARSWIKVVTLDSARQEIVQIEDFLPDFPISKPIDMKFGRDGAMYLLEYGNDYFLNNPDARLVRISYSADNRPPVAKLKVDETAGGIPFQPVLSAAGSSDPDPGDRLSYRWYLDDALSGEGEAFSPVLTRPGRVSVRLEVRDSSGARSEALTQLEVGNARPRVELASTENRSFLFPGRARLPYRASVRDPEDERAGSLNASGLVVNAAWVADPELADGLRRGERQLPSGDLRYAAGAELIAGSDCYTCHREETENVGPAYLEVAQRYPATPENIGMLAGKVIKGGNGNWGERLMSAHPTLSQSDAETMIGYILSLDDGSRLPPAGSVSPGAGEGTYVLAASYRDRGGLVGQGTIVLRSPRLEAEDAFDGLHRAVVPGTDKGSRAFKSVDFRPGGHLYMQGIDLTGVSGVTLRVHADSAGEIELRSGSADGELLAAAEVEKHAGWDAFEDVRLPLSGGGVHDLYLVWKGAGGVVADDMGHHRPADVGRIDYLTFFQ